MSQSTDSVEFDELPEPIEDEDDENSDYIDLEPGDTLAFEIEAYYPTRGYNGEVVTPDGRRISLNQGMARQIASSLVDGAQMGIRVGTEEQSFTNSDGEEVTYYEKEVRVAQGGD